MYIVCGHFAFSKSCIGHLFKCFHLLSRKTWKEKKIEIWIVRFMLEEDGNENFNTDFSDRHCMKNVWGNKLVNTFLLLVNWNLWIEMFLGLYQVLIRLVTKPLDTIAYRHVIVSFTIIYFYILLIIWTAVRFKIVVINVVLHILSRVILIFFKSVALLDKF